MVQLKTKTNEHNEQEARDNDHFILSLDKKATTVRRTQYHGF
jgi:hypothetical protein